MQDILGFAGKNTKASKQATATRQKAAPQLASTIGQGDDQGYKTFLSQRPSQQKPTQQVPAKAPPKSLLNKVRSFVGDNVVKPTVTTAEKSLNTVAAGAEGAAGAAKAVGQKIRGNDKGAAQTVQTTNRVINDKLTKGAGGKGGFITPEQASKGGTQLIKPGAQAVADIAPLVLPVSKAAKGASLLMRVGKQSAENAVANTAISEGNQAVQGRLTKGNFGETVKGAVQGAVLGAGGALLHEGIKAGKDATNVTPAKDLIKNQKTQTLLDTGRNQPEVKTTYNPSNPQVKTIIEARQKQAEAIEAPAKAAEAEQKANIAETEKTQEQSKKVDRQIELIKAKGKDSDTGLSNVDKTKLTHLQEDKQKLQATSGTVADVKPPTVQPHEASPTQTPAPTAASEKPVSASSGNSTPKEATPKEPTKLTPSQTAHMEPITGYTHSSHLEQDYADMLRGQEKDATVSTVPDGKGGYKRVTEHSKFFRDYYKENGKAPTKTDYLEEAKRHLMSGKDALGASEDYKKLLERESKPIPRMEVNTTPIKGDGEVLKSAVGKGVEARAVSAKLTKSLGDLPEYSKVNMKQQGEDATHLLINDEQKAIDIALGKEAPPAHLLPESVYTAVEAKALATGDVDLLRALAHSTRVGEATTMGQRIRALGEREPNSPVKAIRSVADARKASIERKTGTTLNKAITTEVKAAVAEKPKITKETWGSFVESLRC